jgi:hypothetical protein
MSDTKAAYFRRLFFADESIAQFGVEADRSLMLGLGLGLTTATSTHAST